jgi:hypothetical protein
MGNNKGITMAEKKKKATKNQKTKKILGRPTAYKTPETLQAAIDKYMSDKGYQPVITKNAETGKNEYATDKYGRTAYTNNPPTTAGLAHYLGYASRQSLYDKAKTDDSFSYVIKRVILFIEAYHEANLSLRDKPTGSIFWLKNHQWTDKQEIEHSGSVNIIDDIK